MAGYTGTRYIHRVIFVHVCYIIRWLHHIILIKHVQAQTKTCHYCAGCIFIHLFGCNFNPSKHELHTFLTMIDGVWETHYKIPQFIIPSKLRYWNPLHSAPSVNTNYNAYTRAITVWTSIGKHVELWKKANMYIFYVLHRVHQHKFTYHHHWMQYQFII